MFWQEFSSCGVGSKLPIAPCLFLGHFFCLYQKWRSTPSLMKFANSNSTAVTTLDFKEMREKVKQTFRSRVFNCDQV